MLFEAVNLNLMNKRKKNKDEEEAGLFPEQTNEQSVRSYNLMDNFGGQLLNKWQNKSDRMNPTKSNKNRVNDVIDPTLSSGVLSFEGEAAERRLKVEQRVSHTFLSEQFRGSSILTEHERAEGTISN